MSSIQPCEECYELAVSQVRVGLKLLNCGIASAAYIHVNMLAESSGIDDPLAIYIYICIYIS